MSSTSIEKPTPPAETSSVPGALSVWASGFIVLAGVVLPLLAIAVELGMRLCTEVFFDPLPTVWHVLLYASMAVANGWAWLAIRGGAAVPSSAARAANGLALGVAAVYTLWFLPLLPVSMVAVMAMGLGFLGLSPVLALIATLMCRNHLAAAQGERGNGRAVTWAGFCAAVAALAAVALPTNLTQVGLAMAVSESPAQRARGLKWLRAVGSEDAVLRACYQRQTMMGDLAGFVLAMSSNVTPAEVRAVYYRLTGRPFNSVPPPRLRALQRWDPAEQFEWDADQGGATVAGRVRGLSLVSSRLDGSLDPAGALSYTEWTLVFRNTSRRQREARAQIALPPDGVVSRATLWVDGDEREAAFAQRGRAREAYDRVVRRRRDPLLVTTCGPGRVLLQCFPVPAAGGEMKVRLGITAPLLLDSAEEGTLLMPHFCERNFSLPEDVRHSVWLESKARLKAGTPSLQPSGNRRVHALRGTVTDAQLAGPAVAVRVSRGGDTVRAWAEDRSEKKRRLITQEIRAVKPFTPGHVVVVVDCSAPMEPFRKELAEAFAQLSKRVASTLILAGDETRLVRNHRTERLAELKCRGGCDNLPALVAAWEEASKHRDAAIVWIHAPQPVVLQSVEALVQRYERRPHGVPILALEVLPGPNRIYEEMESCRAIRTVPRAGNLRSDLERVFAQWQPGARVVSRERSRIRDRAPRPSSLGEKTSDHLVRLWAHDEVLRLWRSGDAADRDEAVVLSARYQLVTPVSGAVVLENQQQFDEAGLRPVNADSVPTIPEPETWALLIVAGAVLLWTVHRRRRACVAT